MQEEVTKHFLLILQNNSSVKKIILQKKAMVSQNRRRTPKMNTSLSNYNSNIINKTMWSEQYFKKSDSNAL